jgi:hypothetical protein
MGKAGERSLRRSAYVEAIGHFRWAIDFAAALPDVPALRTCDCVCRSLAATR